jgi:hypothetical protein
MYTIEYMKFTPYLDKLVPLYWAFKIHLVKKAMFVVWWLLCTKKYIYAVIMCFIEQFSGSWFLSNEIFQSPGFFQ